MSKFNRVLCPVDLSENSLTAIGLATTIAKENGAKLCFFYVAPQWLPEEAMMGTDYVRRVIEEGEQTLGQICPTDESVPFEHQMVNGNPGPEVVRASKTADVVVMSTHGHSGLVRFVMGSVAQYVLRNAKCPVVLAKGIVVAEGEPDSRIDKEDQTFIFTAMRQVAPVHAFDDIESVLNDLSKANETAAPVVDGSGTCIGILTTTDIEKYHSLKRRFEDHDETVIDEMFEVDKYGQRRPSNLDFDRTERHMTKDVISINTDETIQKATELFESNPEIHHLVVLDDAEHAVGIVNVLDLVGVKSRQKKATEKATK